MVAHASSTLPVEDISKYAADAGSYVPLSAYQISQFFGRHVSITKDNCNGTAADILKSLVSPTLVQGGSSYTVIADSDEVTKVVQFRSRELDMELMQLIKQAYGNFVPSGEYHGTLSDVHVYVWDRIPGPAFCLVRHRFLTPEMEPCLRRTVQDFARSLVI
jgi:hypothetical protein